MHLEESPEEIIKQYVAGDVMPAVAVKNNKPAISYFGQFGILIGMIGGGLIAGGLLSVLVWMMMTGSFL